MTDPRRNYYTGLSDYQHHSGVYLRYLILYSCLLAIWDNNIGSSSAPAVQTPVPDTGGVMKTSKKGANIELPSFACRLEQYER